MTSEDIVEKFNKQFPVGSTVDWRSIGKDGVPFRRYTVKFSAVNHNGTPVAWFAEKTGMASVEPEFVDYK